MFGAARIHLPDPSCLNSAERAGAGRNVGRVNEQALRLMPGHRGPRRLASSCVPFSMHPVPASGCGYSGTFRGALCREA